jgi:hypothetical protein
VTWKDSKSYIHDFVPSQLLTGNVVQALPDHLEGQVKGDVEEREDIKEIWECLAVLANKALWANVVQRVTKETKDIKGLEACRD